ncbi:MAG: glutamate-5-semialdehyde dehydrogenase [Phycisphaerales bacterium JB063]
MTTTAPPTDSATDLAAQCRALADRAAVASRALAASSSADRTSALHAIARAIRDASPAIQQANAKDLEAGKTAGLSSAMLDRLTLDAGAVEAVANAVDNIAKQPDPLGQVVEGRVLDNGITLEKRRVPIGVVLMIYESRPNVTSDAAALCIRAGNAVILRGGKEATHSNRALADAIAAGLEQAGLDPHTVQLVQTTDRAAVSELLKMEGKIDVCIPRGGPGLIQAVTEQARIPVLKHDAGNCHLYIDARCDPQMAVDIVLNAKTQRPGVCNAIETLLVHADAAAQGTLHRVCEVLARAGVEVRGDARTQAEFPGAKTATDADWATEFLDMILAVRVVDSLEQAAQHINYYGSKHTEAILTDDYAAAERFTRLIDAANVFVNCSTRFADGGQYGLGAEIGISTNKLHARGPVGAQDLTTTQWVARGNGQTRK